ncbi:MFS transporter [Streptomyces candidus]|uniref:MFS transporter n=1 Tax=Streptomyces candidus TaxID=67283 RepID=A0A7X0H9T7_9ACTN|nr:MFS transporter [Streptomyces candidus]MBB6433565.1 hypothetical protein [Streptomyces candidus]GHH35387.1 MFS transporter [Streptomyces candidus]
MTARTGHGTGPQAGARQVLRDRNASLFLTVVVVTGFGTTALWLVAGVWVKSLTGSDSLAALTTFSMWLPVLAGPLLGAVADRFPRRPLLVAVNLSLAVLLTALCAVDRADRVWVLFGVLLLYGVGGTLCQAAESALVATAVGPRLLGDFNGLRMTAQEGVKLLAPLAGAALFARFGGPSVALLDAVTCALAAGLVMLLRVREDRPAQPTSPKEPRYGATRGSRFLLGSGVLRPLLLAGAATMVLSGVNGAALFAVVDEGLGHSPTYAGVMYAAQGAGTVILGILALPLLRRLPERVFAAAGIALFALSAGLRALPYDAVVLVASAGIGAGLPCVLVGATTAVQREAPDAMLGRVSASAHFLVYGPMAAAIAAGSALIAVVDHRVVLVGIAGCGVAVALALVVRGGANRRAGRTT